MDSLIFSGRSIAAIEQAGKDSRGKAKEPLTEALIAEVETLVISEGEHVGENFVVLDWEADFIDGVATHTYVGLSIARANGKTTLAAAVASSAFCGKLSRPRGQVVLVAASLKQGNVAFQHVKEFLRPRIESEFVPGAATGYKKKRFRVIDNAQSKEIIDDLTGSKLILIGSDSELAHGLAPSFVLADEPAKWKSGGKKMYTALKTGMGKQLDSKFVALGTKPDGPDHWFTELLENPSEDTYIQKHETTEDDPDFEMRVIRKANPVV